MFSTVIHEQLEAPDSFSPKLRTMLRDDVIEAWGDGAEDEPHVWGVLDEVQSKHWANYLQTPTSSSGSPFCESGLTSNPLFPASMYTQ